MKSKLSLTMKFLIPIVIILIVLSSLFLTRLYNEIYNTIYKQKQETLLYLVDISSGIINSFEEKFESNEISLEDIYEQLRILIPQMKYDDNNYIFVYDFKGNIVVPYGGRKIGENFINMQDSDGKYIVQDFIDIAKKDKSGFYDYNFEKPNSNLVAPKLSYIDSSNSLDFFWGTGFYIDDIQKEVLNVFISDLILFIISTIISIIIISFIGFFIRKRIKSINEKIADFGSGNLKVSFEEKGSDEISYMSYNLNIMVSKLRTIVSDIIEITSNLNISSDELKKVSEVRRISKRSFHT
ncbi:cache domain-containing protein [Oceanotoga teriensis]|uniref:cache domain-containing protein n=1 Tax=Oceanotoga teriensis TaxID=515440 RepID=UPI002714291E|nr:methyl-accepting chemotaxis protein [Oceanotoga teriensis]MDO7976776.1 methyl-accepting chemotaxis protein [Oceanotoga teriensis]